MSTNASDQSDKSSVPTYFVLCRRVCGAVKPGKLRIRCVGCREDKIIVTKEPQQWSDILQKGTIQGVCHTRGCRGPQPEFYFKCRGHEGQDHDHVVPLPLVRNNFLKVSCMTCLDDDRSETFTFVLDLMTSTVAIEANGTYSWENYDMSLIVNPKFSIDDKK